MISISQRLQAIAYYIKEGSYIADIGTDHALLPVFLAENNRICRAIAGELNEGPYQSAVQQVLTAGQQHIVQVRKGNGLQVIEADEVDTVVIAGMGGSLICSILDAGKYKLNKVKQLILQPNVGEINVRKWLLEEDWYLTDETILKEDDKIYEVLVAEKIEKASLLNEKLYSDRVLECDVILHQDDMLRLGPYLIQTKKAMFYEKWNSESDKLERIMKSIEQSELQSAAEKRKQLKREQARMKEVIQCLQKDKR